MPIVLLSHCCLHTRRACNRTAGTLLWHRSPQTRRTGYRLYSFVELNNAYPCSSHAILRSRSALQRIRTAKPTSFRSSQLGYCIFTFCLVKTEDKVQGNIGSARRVVQAAAPAWSSHIRADSYAAYCGVATLPIKKQFDACRFSTFETKFRTAGQNLRVLFCPAHTELSSFLYQFHLS